MNVVLLAKNRKDLTYQALDSFRRHTLGSWNLVIVDDASEPQTASMLYIFEAAFPGKVVLQRFEVGSKDSGILGQLKNAGVAASEAVFGRSDWLYLSDNDVFFSAGWDDVLRTTAARAEAEGFELVGGQNHPYHLPVGYRETWLQEYEAVAGTSWLMRWATWDKYGPLDGNAPGVQQSEDTAFCVRVRKGGGKVGALAPPVVYDTGIHQTDGSLSIGHERKQRRSGVRFE